MRYVALAVVLAAAVTTAQAGVVNGSFEDGLNGWSVNLNGGKVTTNTKHIADHINIFKTWTPTDGLYFAELQAGDANSAVSISQQLSGPGILCVDWFFDSFEPKVLTGSFPDFEWSLRRNDSAGGVVDGEQIFRITSADVVGRFLSGSTDWRTQNIVVDNPGLYTLSFAVRNRTDSHFGSVLGIDNIVWKPIPEPMTMLAVFSSMAGLAGYVRRRFA